MEGLVQGIPLQERIIFEGDFNRHVGKKARQYIGFHGGFGFSKLNEEGKSIIDFLMTYGLKIVNTHFKK